MIDSLHITGEHSHRELGRTQGEVFGAAAAELARIRFDLAWERMGRPARESMAALAMSHLPVLAAFDAGLHDELLGFAEASGIAPWQLVILNHYTDFRDIPADAGGCSTVFVPADRGSIAAQTWDMHASAEPHVRMMDLTPPGGPRVALFTLAGCQGMTGMNEAGVAVCINNLTPSDARVGVLWPSVVRRMLRARTAQAAVEELRHATLGSGHNYLVADPLYVYNVETTATRIAVTHSDSGRHYFHTNHYLDPGLQTLELPPVAGSTSRQRYSALSQMSFSSGLDVEGIQRLLSGVCSHGTGDDPAASKTCGAMICDLVYRRVHAACGCVHDATWTEVSL